MDNLREVAVEITKLLKNRWYVTVLVFPKFPFSRKTIVRYTNNFYQCRLAGERGEKIRICNVDQRDDVVISPHDRIFLPESGAPSAILLEGQIRYWERDSGEKKREKNGICFLIPRRD
jgi:hypothetical protein